MKIDREFIEVELSKGQYLIDLIMESRNEAIRRGIKADSIVINQNMVYVPDLFNERPEMVCGLDVYLTKDELPDRYSFAILHNCNKETDSPWISVAERLPKHFEHVLLNIPGEKPFNTVHEGYLEKDGFWNIRMYRCDPEDVTHWMPLPEPPKGD